jgi:hypothetical protein
MAAAQSYDAVQLMLRVMFQTKGDLSAGALKAALEKLDRPYAGVVTTHDQPFSATDHESFTRNMIWLGVWRKGEVHFQYPDDAKRASIIRRKETAQSRPGPASLHLRAAGLHDTFVLRVLALHERSELIRRRRHRLGHQRGQPRLQLG